MRRTLVVVALLAAAQGLPLRRGPSLRPGVVDRLRSDEAFMATGLKGTGDVLNTVDTSEHPCDNKYWDRVGQPFWCGMEVPEHSLVRRWIPKNATVMEFGARFGTTTCEIAKKTGNSGKLVAVEPDKMVWSSLSKNLESHNCRSHVVQGVIGSKPVTFMPSNYSGRTQEVGANEQGGTVIPNFQFDEIESALGMRFDTLLIDCEGCVQFMMDQLEEKIKTQINLVVFEADMPTTAEDCKKNCMDYAVFIKFLENSGFHMLESFNDCDKAKTGQFEEPAPKKNCFPWIEHYAFGKVK